MKIEVEQFARDIKVGKSIHGIYEALGFLIVYISMD